MDRLKVAWPFGREDQSPSERRRRAIFIACEPQTSRSLVEAAYSDFSTEDVTPDGVRLAIDSLLQRFRAYGAARVRLRSRQASAVLRQSQRVYAWPKIRPVDDITDSFHSDILHPRDAPLLRSFQVARVRDRRSTRMHSGRVNRSESRHGPEDSGDSPDP